MKINLEQLCMSANHKLIMFDPIHSHTATHFNDSPGLRDIVINIISKEKLTEPVIAKDIDMGKNIGDSDVVEIDESDDLIYAMRKNRENQGYIPLTKSRTSQPSRLVSIYLVRKNKSTYELLSTWIGKYDSPPFPQMDNASDESIPYWNKHAFVWGNQETIPGTEIFNCPW